MTERPGMTVAVVMRREQLQGEAARWQRSRGVLADVVAQDELALPDGVAGPFQVTVDEDDARVAAADAAATDPAIADPAIADPDTSDPATADQYWMYPGFRVELFRDDVEGLYLNLTTEHPCFWVMWRHEDETDAASLPQPRIVTLSYHDAGRWLDAQERVDQVPATAQAIDWARAFVSEHYRPEPKRRRRPQSFQSLTDRFGKPARVATGKTRGGGGQPHGE